MLLSLLLASAHAEEAAEAVEADPTWGQELVEKFAEIPLATWLSVLAIGALGVILLAACRSYKKWSAKAVAFAALSIALSFVLSCLRLYRMPWGGSITPGSMLPIMLFAVAFGAGPGVLAGLVYGILQFLQSPSSLSGLTLQQTIVIFLFDYLIAFAVLGLAGIAHKKGEKWLYASIPLAVLARAFCHIFSGLEWAALYGMETIFGIEFSSPVLYSVVYNLTYLVPEAIICLLLALLIAKPVLKVMRTY